MAGHHPAAATTTPLSFPAWLHTWQPSRPNHPMVNFGHWSDPPFWSLASRSDWDPFSVNVWFVSQGRLSFRGLRTLTGTRIRPFSGELLSASTTPHRVAARQRQLTCLRHLAIGWIQWNEGRQVPSLKASGFVKEAWPTGKLFSVTDELGPQWLSTMACGEDSLLQTAHLPWVSHPPNNLATNTKQSRI
jgi:hypothetical protein